MVALACARCVDGRAVLKRPKTGEPVRVGRRGRGECVFSSRLDVKCERRPPTSPTTPPHQLCKPCFYAALEAEVHATITRHSLFRPGQRVAVAASGGKDSTVLAHILTTLNTRHAYGLDLFLLSVDEGIAGYRADSLAAVQRNAEAYGLPLVLLSHADLYRGWTVDAVAAATGRGSNCTFCGVLRRQALDRGAIISNADVVATGHNADDVAETVLLNLVRGDGARLARCGCAVTGEVGGGGCGGGDNTTNPRPRSVPRVKPFLETYEKEIVLYAHHKRLDYFSTECVYAPFAARGAPRELVKYLEAVHPATIAALVRTAEGLAAAAAAAGAARIGPPVTAPGTCTQCGALASGDVCKACQLVAGLEAAVGRARTGDAAVRPARLAGRRREAAGPLKFEE